jgi:hypothetical protein
MIESVATTSVAKRPRPAARNVPQITGAPVAMSPTIQTSAAKLELAA